MTTAAMKSTFQAVLMGCAAIALGCAATGTARAQGWQDIARDNAEFDQRMNSQLMALRQQNNARMQALWRNYLTQFGPMLRQQYVATGANHSMTFEQFAYWNMMTANGTNVQAGLDAQRRQFEGNQQAHETVMQGYHDYNQAMQHNSDVTMNALNNYDHQAIRGESQYANPNGGDQWLSNAPRPGQVFASGGNHFVRDQQGNTYQWQGNGWMMLPPR